MHSSFKRIPKCPQVQKQTSKKDFKPAQTELPVEVSANSAIHYRSPIHIFIHWVIDVLLISQQVKQHQMRDENGSYDKHSHSMS